MSAGNQSWELPNTPSMTEVNTENWYAVHTRARHERAIAQRLREQGINTFLPLVTEVHRWSDRRKSVEVPLFGCYVFVKLPLTGEHRLQVLKIDGVFRFVGASGLEATFDAATRLVRNGIPGDFVECGVARGGCAALMATVAAHDSPVRKMWLFDSFEGLPAPTSEDYGQNRESTGKHVRPLVRGSCLGTKEQVEALLFSRFGFARDSIALVPGWFQNTLPVWKQRIGKIALLRIDGDWYESTMCCLDNLYDSVAPGGSIIIDDYGVCFGCKKAVHEFFSRRNLHPRLIPDNRGGVRFSKAS